jgi:acyl-coenzyme A synthetase/AMP-(fatty) acid ligase
MGDLIAGSALDGRGEALRGRSVLLIAADQLIAALVLLELDGIARRIVLCPSDLPLEYVPFVSDAANADAIVTDRTTPIPGIEGIECFKADARKIVPQTHDRNSQLETEWILLTSGTSGRPKLVLHTLFSLAGGIRPSTTPMRQVVWTTFYDIRRYGGLYIFLTTVMTGCSLVLSSPSESPGDFMARAAENGVTHILGTPSHWRRALMSPSAHLIDPQSIHISGEIADQAILNHLQAVYPRAEVQHGFASTEAGVAFDVTDGLAGFPAKVIDHTPNVEMRVVDGSLRIRSARNARCYLGGHNGKLLKDADGFVDTADIIELRGDRYYFAGRRDGVINVGGLKVHPEEVEAVINRHPAVQMSLVRMKKSPIIGALVVADVVLKTATQEAGQNMRAIEHDILRLCRESLTAYKVPAAVYFVPALALGETGKLRRNE